MEQAPDVRPLRPHTRMQLDLAERLYGHRTDQGTFDWVNRYAIPFEQLVGTRPQILERYESDPRGALEEAERFLYANAPAAEGRGVRESRS